MSPSNPQPVTVLAVSGAPAELEAVILALRASGFAVRVVTTGADALAPEQLRRHSAILVEDTVGDMGLLELVRELRHRSNIPIVVVTESTVEENIVALLEAGADQCSTKPVPIRELVARVRAAIRRTSRPEEETAGIEIGDVRLDPVGHVVTVGGREVRLTNKEFALLHFLMANASQILPRRLIIERVWGADAAEGKTLDTHIRRIRAKIEDNPSTPKRITTVRKIGYRYHRPTRASHVQESSGR